MKWYFQVGFLLVGAVLVHWAVDIGENGNHMYTTADRLAEGLDLHGKVAIVTGANSGIGYETVRLLAQQGAKVVLTARSLKKAEDAANQLRDAYPGSVKLDLVPMELELKSLVSVKKFAEQFLALGLPLHYLILNAGVMAITERTTTEFGVETQMGVNHVAHFYLAKLLTPKLEESAPSRLVSLASSAEGLADVTFLDSPNLENSYYSEWWAYGNSKLANILFAKEFHARYSKKGITAVSLHPGAIRTNLQQHVEDRWDGFLINLFGKLFFKTVNQGAATTIYAATSPEITEKNLGGRYFANAHVSWTTHPDLVEKDHEGVAAKKLWVATENLLQKKFLQ